MGSKNECRWLGRKGENTFGFYLGIVGEEAESGIAQMYSYNKLVVLCGHVTDQGLRVPRSESICSKFRLMDRNSGYSRSDLGCRVWVCGDIVDNMGQYLGQNGQKWPRGSGARRQDGRERLLFYKQNAESLQTKVWEAKKAVCVSRWYCDWCQRGSKRSIIRFIRFQRY